MRRVYFVTACCRRRGHKLRLASGRRFVAQCDEFAVDIDWQQ